MVFKMKKKDLNYFKKLNYNILLKRISKKYYLFIPELSLMSEDDKIDSAYKNLQKKKLKYFKTMIKINAQEAVTEPIASFVKRKILIDLGIFFVKFIIILVTFLLFFLLSLPLFQKELSQVPNRIADLIINQSERLKNTPSENKQKIRIKIHEIVKELKPFVDEIKILFEEEDKQDNLK